MPLTPSRVVEARFGALLPLTASLLFAYWWDTTVLQTLRRSENVWIPAAGSVLAAGLILACGWFLYHARGRALLVDLAFLLSGGVVLFANPLSTIGLDIPGFGDLGLYATIGMGVLLKLMSPFIVVLGGMAMASRLSAAVDR